MKPKAVKTNYIIAYIVLLALALLLAFTRWFSYMNSSVKLPKFILDHITNFSISLTVVLIIGFVALIFGSNMTGITAVCFIMTVLNFICETSMSAMNTADITDAIFGFCGVAIAYIYLFMLYKRGLKNE